MFLSAYLHEKMQISERLLNELNLSYGNLICTVHEILITSFLSMRLFFP